MHRYASHQTPRRSRRRSGARSARRCSRAGVKSTIVLGLDHFAGDVVDAAERIREAQLDAPLTGPDQPTEELRAIPSGACRVPASPRR